MVTVNDVNGNPVDCDKYPNNETCTKLGYNRIKNANIPDNKGILGLGVLGLGGKKRKKTNKKKTRKTKKTTKKKTSKKHRHKTTKNKK